MTNLTVRVTVTLALTILADYLLFGHSPGCGLSVFSVCVAGAVWARYGARLRRAGPWPALWLVLALGATLQSSLFGRMLLVVLGWSILALTMSPTRRPLLSGILRGVTGGVRSLTAAPADARRYLLLMHRRLAGGPPPAWVLALPIGLVLVFAFLIIPANLVLVRWSEQFFDKVATLFPNVTFGRVLFWLLMGLGVYGLFRFRLGRRHWGYSGASVEVGPVDATRRRNELKACVLTFIGLNALFLVANLTDVFYLWLAFELPRGLTYSQFARHGAYRLIVAVVLAAVTITAFLRSNTLQAEQRRTRLLAYAFAAQNLLVLAGAARRLQFYVEAYGLTRFRLAAALWMGLVATGFILILIKIREKRPLRFLLRTNAVSTVLLLSAVSLLNLDGFIADWNVARHEAGATTPIDVDYLGSLSVGALPALARLVDAEDSEVAARARAVLTERLAEEKAAHASWQAWTWRREAAIDALEQTLRPAGKG